MHNGKRFLYLSLFWAINFCLGSFYAWSIYSTWLSEVLSAATQTIVSPSSLAYIFSIGAALNPIAMILGGFVSDRYSPRIVLLLGGFLASLGYFLMSISEDASLILLGYGICLGMGSGACVIATVSTAVKLFPDKRGFASGSVSAFYGVGSICLPPLANYLASTIGISRALQLFACICFIVIVLSASVIQVKSKAQTQHSIQQSDFTWLEMIKTKRFWAMFILFVSVTLSPLMLFSQTVTIAQIQVELPITLAVLSVSILACANTLARFVAGVLSDSIGRANTLLIAVTLAIVGLVLLSLASVESQGLFFLGLICIGACFGSSVGVFPSYAAEQFGVSHASMNYGVLALAFSVAGLLGPNIIHLTVNNGQYEVAYYIAIAISLLGVIAAICCKRIERRV